MKKRLDDIDLAKGILIILVVVGHIWQNGVVHNIIYSFHMPGFFIISGMLAAYTNGYKKRIGIYTVNKAISYGIPFLFAESLGVLTDIIRNGVLLNWKGYIWNTLSLNYNDPELWFLVTLFLVEIIFAVAKRIVDNELVLAVISIIGCLLITPKNAYLGALQVALMWFPYFVVGFHFGNFFRTRKKRFFVISLLVVLCVGIIFGKREGGIAVRNLPYFVSGICGTYVILWISHFFEHHKCRIVDSLKNAGKNSIIIYNTHRLYYTAIGLCIGITNYKSTPLLAGIFILFIVLLVEIPTIYVIKKRLPILSGEIKRKER